jgi:hypothetical protein
MSHLEKIWVTDQDICDRELKRYCGDFNEGNPMRKELASQITASREIIQKFFHGKGRRLSPYKELSSYTLKHLFEEYRRKVLKHPDYYVSNSALIIAMIEENFEATPQICDRYERVEVLNYYFNISPKGAGLLYTETERRGV